jgi:glycosyltransferase involved in cell wall biosynthesis
VKVSTIVRTYNRCHILGDALSSVLNQTYPDFEVIIVDDGSTDNTQEVVGKFRSEKIRYARHGQNRGVSAAGNTGINLATGDVVAHLDSDDLWKPEMLEKMVGFLTRTSEAGVVFCDLDVIRGQDSGEPDTDPQPIATAPGAFGDLLARHSNPAEIVFTNREMYLCLLEEVPLKPTTTLVRREVLETVGGYDESWRSGEDWELYLRICRNYRFGFLNERLATMRVQDDSTLGRMQEHDKVSLLAWEAREKKAIKGDDEACAAINRAMLGHYDILGHTYLQQGRRLKAAVTYFRGFVATGSLRLAVRVGWALVPGVAAAALRRGRSTA